jgi:flagellar hook-associated protein 2
MSAGSSGNLSLSGLASGIDTSSIVDQLMQIEQRPRIMLALKQKQEQNRQQQLKDIDLRLTTLKGLAQDLKSPGLYADVQTVSSSDASKVDAVRVSGAGTGGSQVSVQRLASSQQRSYQFASSASDTTLSVTSGATTFDITIPGGSDVQGAVDAINSAAGSPVYAAAVTDQADPTKKLIVLSSKSPGTTGDFSVSGTSTASVRELVARGKTHAAAGAEKSYSYTPPAAATTVQIDGVNDFTITAGSDLASAASQINAQSTKVNASVFDGRLVLTSKTTGASSAFALSGNTGVLDGEIARAGADAIDVSTLKAQYSVDGATYYADSNVVTDGIPGLQLTLKATTTTPITVTVGSPGADQNAIKAKIKAYVDQYNSTVDFIRGKLSEQRVVNPQTDAEYMKGLLFGDPGLSTILSSLRQAASDVIPGSDTQPNPATMNMLSQIGVSTGGPASGTSSPDAVAGKLSIDDAKLTSALASDPMGVRRLLGGVSGVDGFAQRIENLLHPVVDTDGVFDGRVKSSADSIKSMQDQLDDMDRRLALRQAALKAKFTAMETALSQSQSQGSWLAGQIAGLSR